MDSKELVFRLAKQLGWEPSRVEDLLGATARTLADDLRAKQSFTLPGFGTFGTRNAKKRRCYNPATGAMTTLGPRAYPFYRPSAPLRRRLRADTAHEGEADDPGLR